MITPTNDPPILTTSAVSYSFVQDVGNYTIDLYKLAYDPEYPTEKSMSFKVRLLIDLLAAAPLK